MRKKRIRFVALVVSALCLFAASAAVAQQRKKPAGARKPAQARKAAQTTPVEYLTGRRSRPLPFSDAVRVGHMLYLSGQIGTGPDFALVAGGIKAETKQTMENIRRVLEAHGSSLDRVVKCTVMLADMSEWGAMNEVYVTYFREGRFPARSALGTSGLALGARVEIECWATVD